MAFDIEQVVTLIRIPAGAFTMLIGRSVVVKSYERSDTGRDIYTVETLFPLSAEDYACLDRSPGTHLRLKVQGGQLQAISEAVVHVDMSIVMESDWSDSG